MICFPENILKRDPRAVLGFPPEGDGQWAQGTSDARTHARTESNPKDLIVSIRRTLDSPNRLGFQQTMSRRGLLSQRRTHAHALDSSEIPLSVVSRASTNPNGIHIGSGVHKQYAGCAMEAHITAWVVEMPINCQTSGVYKTRGGLHPDSRVARTHTHTPDSSEFQRWDWKCS